MTVKLLQDYLKFGTWMGGIFNGIWWGTLSWHGNLSTGLASNLMYNIFVNNLLRLKIILNVAKISHNTLAISQPVCFVKVIYWWLINYTFLTYYGGLMPLWMFSMVSACINECCRQCNCKTNIWSLKNGQIWKTMIYNYYKVQ